MPPQRIIPKGCFSKKVLPKGHYSEICNFILTCDFFGEKTVPNNDEPLEYRSTYMPFKGELSKLLARLLLVDLCLGIRVGQCLNHLL